jgi:hypothetical protein
VFPKPQKTAQKKRLTTLERGSLGVADGQKRGDTKANEKT